MNREAERRRLVELLKTLKETPEVACLQFNKGCEGCQFERGMLCDIEGREANYLLDNGVIVPPCKVGDKVYVIDVCSCTHHYERLCTANNKRQKNTKWLAIAKIPPTYSYSRCLKLFERPFKIEYLNKIGKTVFLTREEAEKALKER